MQLFRRLALFSFSFSGSDFDFAGCEVILARWLVGCGCVIETAVDLKKVILT